MIFAVRELMYNGIGIVYTWVVMRCYNCISTRYIMYIYTLMIHVNITIMSSLAEVFCIDQAKINLSLNVDLLPDT